MAEHIASAAGEQDPAQLEVVEELLLGVLGELEQRLQLRARPRMPVDLHRHRLKPLIRTP
jgi:hypothetical protein